MKYFAYFYVDYKERRVDFILGKASDYTMSDKSFIVDPDLYETLYFNTGKFPMNFNFDRYKFPLMFDKKEELLRYAVEVVLDHSREYL